MSAESSLAYLWQLAGCAPDVLSTCRFSGSAEQLPSVFAVGNVASASIAAQALATASISYQRSGTRQQVGIDQRHALAMFRSEPYLRIDGQPPYVNCARG